MFRTRISSMLRRNLWRLLAFLERLWIGGRVWGYLRLFFVFVAFLIFLSWGRSLYYEPGMAPLGWLTQHSLRLMIFPVAALLGAMLVVAAYIRDVYELPGLWLGLRYLIPAAFGIFHPRLVIRDGRRQIRDNEVNLLDAVGGPGYLVVAPGSVVLLERLIAPSNVVAAGIHYVTRLERVKEVASLEDQQDNIQQMSATTRDGVEIALQNVNYRFRIRTGRQPADYTRRTPERPYPFSSRALYNLAYRRTVSLDINGEPRLTSLATAVRNQVGNIITDRIYRMKIDELTAPVSEGQNPRLEITRAFESPVMRQRFRDMGVELLWVDIGHFAIMTSVVREQRVDTWQARWIGTANVTRAYGEAQRLAYQELGRAEAQAEMLLAILETLRAINPTGKLDEAQMRSLVLMRIAQILDAWTEHDQPAAGALPPAGNPPQPARSNPPTG